jgi:hypothetical protein
MSNVVQISNPAPSGGLSLGGVMSAVGQHVLDKQARDEAEKMNNRPIIQGLAGHVRKVWETNKRVKQNVEDRMLRSLRQRRGEYSPEKLQQIREQGGSEVYMMISSAKARAISSWLRDGLLANGTEKPWTVDPTPLPEMSPEKMQEALTRAEAEMQLLAASGQPIDMRAVLRQIKAEITEEMQQESREVAERMETYMEDQLVEGGFMQALSECLDDFTTFPAMVIKGPVVRKRTTAQWGQGIGGAWEVTTGEELRLEWERVDPFMVFPSEGAATPDDGDFIEMHRLNRKDLHAMKGVEGYSDSAIDAVLDEYGRGGLRDWTDLDAERASAEDAVTSSENSSKLIDALQMWGSVPGSMLVEWGMSEEEVPDPLAEYEAEVWLVGRWVIKAVLNPDPLGRRGYYKVSWEELPGMFWGNSPMDQMRDCEDMCNASARALANNMGIASGPQVWINVDRLPQGEDITNLYPWKIHQFINDPMTNATTPPMGFFQPDSNAAELMAVYERFAAIADEVVAVPRYMSGTAPGGGIGRTATGMNMLMQNAGKVMQQAVAMIDLHIMTPLLERLYQHNMMYADDQEIKGDVKVRARGAKSLIAREAAQARRLEFLRDTANPYDMQITGIEGRAEVLREVAKNLDMHTDKVVPKAPTQPPLIPGARPVQQAQPQGQELMNGAPVENAFPTPPVGM